MARSGQRHCPDDAAQPDAVFELLGNTLHVCGKLRSDGEKSFVEALRRLMGTDHASLVIDLSGVEHMSGLCVRHIALAKAWAKQKGRPLIVRASEHVFHLLQTADVGKLVRIGPPNE